MKRRTFNSELLKALVILNAVFVLPTVVEAEEEETKRNRKTSQYLVGGYNYGRDIKIDIPNRTTEDAGGAIQTLDLESNEIKSIDVGFNPHGFAQHPTKPNIIASSTKWGHGAGIVDVDSGKVVTIIKPPENLRFFGHTQFDAEGLLYLSAAENDHDLGHLVVYSLEEKKIVRTIASGGTAPHDFYFSGKDTICIANSGYKNDEHPDGGNVSILNVKSGKIITQYKTPEPAHLLSRNKNEVIIGTIVFGTPQGEFYRLNLDNHKLSFAHDLKTFAKTYAEGEKLSLAWVKDDLVGVTCPSSKQILLWNLKEGTVSSRAFTKSIKGFVSRKTDVLISDFSGRITSLSLTPDSKSLGPETIVAENFSNSSHMNIFSYRPG